MNKLLGIALFFPMFIFGQNLQITGVAPEFVGEKVELKVYQDFISQMGETIATGIVEDDSTFKLSCEIDTFDLAYVQIKNSFGKIYIQPGGNYKILYPGPQILKDKTKASNQIQLIFEEMPPVTDINVLTLDFDRQSDRFIAWYYVDIGADHWKDTLDMFKNYIVERYDTIQNMYFMDHVLYSFGELEQLGMPKEAVDYNKFMTYDIYLRNKSVKYHQEMYMNLVKELYNGILSSRSLSKELELALYKHVLNENLYAVKTLVRNDRLIETERMAELAILVNVRDMYYSRDFPRKKILTLLDKMVDSTKFEEHKLIAANVKARLNKIQRSYPVPELELLNKAGDTIPLYVANEKYYYISFFETWSSTSISEMVVIKELREEFGDQIEFVSICLDPKKKTFDDFIYEHKKEFKWKILWAPDRAYARSLFNVESYPEYFFIDPVGNVLMAPAYRPTPSGNGVSIRQAMVRIKAKDMESRRSKPPGFRP